LRKIDIHKEDLKDLLRESLESKDEKPLIKYIIANSNLPGRRGNIEMAAAFDQVISESFQDNLNKIWDLSVNLTKISSYDAPTNNPKEMIPFCGTRALGAIGAISDIHFEKIITKMKELANDPRWRMREAVAAAIGRMLKQRGQRVLHELETWIQKDNWLEMRAVATGVAHPSTLKENSYAKKALDLHKTIFKRIIEIEDKKSENFKILTKGLCYTLSVVTQATPEAGFKYMKQLLELNDAEVKRIVRENLKKNRLKKNYPKEVAILNKLLLSLKQS
jgi:hypothetical protein